eukprot:3329031-Ditylum_brightwellii.AAC.1
MMQSTLLCRIAPTLTRHALSSNAAKASSVVTLNFNLPHETIYNGGTVSQVIVPGAAGGYGGVTADHVPDISCLEAVKVDDIDPATISSNFDPARNAHNVAEAGSAAQAEAI